MDQFACEAVVVGAGVVGLAAARALALSGREVVILEHGARIGGETSSRNSEVIHAGLYYPQGSLKARLSVRGRELLYDFAGSHGVPHRRLGKWLVASEPGQAPQLAAIKAAAATNGVGDLDWVTANAVRQGEPELRFAEVLESPSTGIIDSHAYMLALLGDAEDAGTRLVLDAEVEHVARTPEGYRLTVRNGSERFALDAKLAVNSAGLWAQKLARATEGLDGRFVPPLHLAKGSYATLAGRAPFRRLIYPIPEPGGLGVHLTLDMAGGARFGPDVEWLGHDDPARIDYAVAPDIGPRFAARIKGWWPGVDASRLTPGYSGCRPKLTGIGEAAADFRIDGPEIHGLESLVNLFGIESPGLTASLAIAERVAALLNP